MGVHPLQDFYRSRRSQALSLISSTDALEIEKQLIEGAAETILAVVAIQEARPLSIERARTTNPPKRSLGFRGGSSMRSLARGRRVDSSSWTFEGSFRKRHYMRQSLQIRVHGFWPVPDVAAFDGVKNSGSSRD